MRVWGARTCCRIWMLVLGFRSEYSFCIRKSRALRQNKSVGFHVWDFELKVRV